MDPRRESFGFTFLEISITVVVLGILASIGLPKYYRVVEKSRAAEAKAILAELRNAQVRYMVQENHFTNVLADLDVTASGMKFFTPSVAGTLTTEAAALLQATGVATCARNAFQNISGFPAGYVVTINQQGAISSADANVQGRLL